MVASMAKPLKALTYRRAPKEKARIQALFERFEAATAHPRTELNYKTPFELVTAVALSAQATDVGVNKATANLFAAANTPKAILALGEAGVIGFINSIGLFRNKAKNLIAMSRLLIERHDGEVPLDRLALQDLPGVGRKTASVVLNELNVEPAIAVDTHVFRVSHRLGLSTAKTPDAAELELTAIIPTPFLTRAHHWLILHGRYICIARRPKCHECPVASLCPSRDLFFP